MTRKIGGVVMAALYITGIAGLSYAMSCGDTKSQDKQVSAVAGDTASTKAVNVGNTICPVTGEKIDEKNKVTYEYQGKVYNFCCAACPPAFMKDPQKYIKKIEEEKQKQHSSPGR